MNGSIRLFAGTDKAIVPHDFALPRSMGGHGHGLHRDVALARTTRANVLVVGAEQAVSNALALIIVDVEHALVVDRARESLRLPALSGPMSAVIIRNVDALTRDEQGELLDWLFVSKGLSRVISTTSRPLVTLLDSTEFSSTLYYRLNTVYVDLM